MPKEWELRLGKPRMATLPALQTILQSLTFDEMTTFAKGIGADPNKVNQWAQTQAGQESKPSPALEQPQ